VELEKAKGFNTALIRCASATALEMVARTGFGSGLLLDFFANLFSAENHGRFAKNQPLIFLLH
jgi:hypothetical protein